MKGLRFWLKHLIPRGSIYIYIYIYTYTYIYIYIYMGALFALTLMFSSYVACADSLNPKP